MSQEQHAHKQPRHAPDAAAMTFQQRAFVEHAGVGAMGHQQYLPPMVPSVPFPGPDPRYPPIPQLVFPFLEPNSIASRRAISGRPPNMTSNNTHKQDSEEVRDFLAGDNTSSGLSKDEGSLYSPGFATRKRREDDSSTTCPSKNEATARNARDTSQRRDSASQQTQTSASSMPRSRLPSNEIARKAPLRAHTTPLSDEEDEEYTKSARKRPKAKQQRISAKPNGAVKSKRAQHPETPTVDPKNILNRKRAMDDGECEGEDEEQPRRLPEVGLFSPPKVIPRTRPRHNYTVPEKLNGTAKALGPDTWNAYILLAERLLLHEITETEFNKQTMPLFQVFDDRTRKRLNRIIRDEMVLPVLDQVDREWRAYEEEKNFRDKGLGESTFETKYVEAE